MKFGNYEFHLTSNILEALFMLSKLEQRFKECGLELHPKKTKIVYCKDGARKRTRSASAMGFKSRSTLSVIQSFPR